MLHAGQLQDAHCLGALQGPFKSLRKGTIGFSQTLNFSQGLHKILVFLRDFMKTLGFSQRVLMKMSGFSKDFHENLEDFIRDSVKTLGFSQELLLNV